MKKEIIYNADINLVCALSKIKVGELSKRTGIPCDKLNRIARNDQEAKACELAAISEATGVPIDSFLIKMV